MEVYRECQNYNEVLLPEEKIEWQGTPEAFPLLTKENKTALLIRWISCAVLFVGTSILYAFLAARVDAPFNPLVVIVIFIALAYISIIPFQDWKNIQKKVCYYVTNKRVILSTGKNLYALSRSGINVKCLPAEGDCVHILFGSCVNKAGQSYRRYAVMPEVDDDDPSKSGFVFYCVNADKEKLKDFLSV